MRIKKSSGDDDAKASLRAQFEAKKLAELAEHEAKKQAWVRARKLCRSSLGEQADREGWLRALLEFCEAKGRLPSSGEVECVKGVARRAEHALAETRGFQCFASLVTLRESMLAKASREVFGRREYRAAAE